MRRLGFIKFIFVILVGLALVVSGVGGLKLFTPQQAAALQRPENDDVFDTNDYYGVPEDTLVTRPLGEFFPPFEFNFKFNFDVDSGGFPPKTSVDTDLQKLLEPLFTPDEQFQKKSAEIEAPRANVQVSSALIEPEASVALVAQPQGFESVSGIDDLFYGWALDNVSLAGVAAGADPLDLPQASGITSIHSRPTQTDSDGDGMDDDWEIRYGLDPNNPSDAGQDPDADGFVNDFYANEQGEVLRVQPPTSVGEPGASLTNLEEYIWGTDPTNPDTDGDGYRDGEDLAGLGQINLNLIIPPEAQAGDTYDVRLTVLGSSYQKFDRDTNLTKLDSNVKKLIVSDNEQVAASLTIDNPNPVPGDTVTLEASLGQTDFHEGLLNYEWLVNNVPQPDESGESEFTFTYELPLDTVPGTTITFGVKAQNFETGQQAEATLDVLVSDLVQVIYDPKEVVTNKTFTANATLLNETPPEDLIFHWYLDGKEQKSQSGQGQTAFTKEVTESSGDKFELALRVTQPKDSVQIGEVLSVISVQKPEVDIVTPTSYPSPGQLVDLVAIPSFFKTEDLTYEWFVDGESQTEALPNNSTFTVLAGAVNEVMQIDVQVETQGPSPDSATGTEYLTVLLEDPTALDSGAETGKTQPQLAQLAQGGLTRVFTWVSVGVLVITIFVILLMLLKRKNAKKLPKK